MKRLNNLALLFFLLAFILSCQKETEEIIPQTDSFTIEKARTWFETYMTSDLPSGSSLRIKDGISKKVLWEKAVKHLRGDSVIFEIPLQYEKVSGAEVTTIDTKPITFYPAEKSKELQIASKLLVFEDKHGNFHCRIMKMMGDKAYLSKNGTDVNKNTLLRKEGDFSGLVMYYNWDEEFITGFRYEEGKVAGIVSQLKETSAQSNAKVVQCRRYSVNFYQKVCYTDEYGTEHCTDWIYVSADSYLICTETGGWDIVTGDTGGGTSTSTSGSTTANFIIPGQDKSPINIMDYMKCFGTNTSASTYKVTVYIEEPNPTTPDTKYGLNVGHAFIGLKKTTNGTSTEQIFGLYPKSTTLNWVSSKIVNNGNSPHTLKVTFNVNASQFTNAINAAIYLQSVLYNISNYNCADAVFSICDEAGIILPKNKSTFPYGTTIGHSPGQLGYDLRQMVDAYPINTAKGKAPYSKGPCQ